MHVRKVGIAFGAAAILASTLALTSSSAGAAPEGTLRVLAVSTEQSDFDDINSVGDTYAFGGFIRSWADGEAGPRIGRFGVSCIVTSFERFETNCTASVDIDRRRGREGQITIQGLVADEGVFDLAITGGTEDFGNAGGTVTVRDLSETRELLTFRFAD